MRVIAGRYKNKKIDIALKGAKLDYRPTKCNVREAVFNKLMHYPSQDASILDGARVLDVCCGSGSYGIEALSRGAACATFVNLTKEHLRLVMHNIKNLGDESLDVKFVCSDATRLDNLKEQYDVVFVDPPYHINIEGKILAALLDRGLLSDEHIIVLETKSKKDLALSDDFELLSERVYGSVSLYTLRLRK